MSKFPFQSIKNAFDSNNDRRDNSLIVTAADNKAHKLKDLLNGAISVKSFGAKGDGVADDTLAFQIALSLSQQSVFVPNGTYKVTSNLSPACTSIIGESELYTIIKPSSAVSRVLSCNGGPRYLGFFTIDGSNTSGATGIFLGETSSIACDIDNVQITTFAGNATDPLWTPSTAYVIGNRVEWFGNVYVCDTNGTSSSGWLSGPTGTGTDIVDGTTRWDYVSKIGGIGLRLGDCLKSAFNRLTMSYCAAGLWVQGVNESFPTTLNFNSCVANASTGYGARMQWGSNINFLNCDFESSTKEGVIIFPVSTRPVDNVTFDTCWFEQNNGSDTSKFNFLAGNGTTPGGDASNMHVELRNCHFSITSGTAKAAKFDGGIVDAIISNPNLNGIASSISFVNGAQGTLDVLPTNLTPSVPLVDASNKVARGSWLAWIDWAPTSFTSENGASVTLVTNQFARYRFDGKTAHLACDITVQIGASGSAGAWVRTALPTGLTAYSTGSVIGTSLILDGGTFVGGWVSAGGDGFFYVRRIDNSAFTLNQTIRVRVSMSYPLA